MKGFIGAANIDTNSRLCMSSAVTGYKRAFGADVVPCSYDDVENSDLVVLVGSNAARRIRCCSSGWRRRSGIIPDCGSWRSTPTHRYLRDRRPPSGAGPGSDGGLFAGCLTPRLRQEPASMAFATARRRWPPPAAGTWRGWRPLRSACR
nr:Nitrate reductase [Klebsiella pneumoniae]